MTTQTTATETVAKTKASKGASARNSAITGIMVARLNEPHMRAVAARLKLDVAGCDAEQMSVVLDDFFKKQIEKGQDSIQCKVTDANPNGCLGFSTDHVVVDGEEIQIEACPFCNDGNAAEAAPPTEEPEEEVEVAAENDEELEVSEEPEDDERPAVDPDIVESAAVAPTEPAPVPATDTEIDASKLPPEALGVPLAAESTTAVRKKRAKAPKVEEPKPEPARVERADGSDARKATNGATTALAKAGDGAIVVHSEADLDARIAEYKEADRDSMGAWWRKYRALGMIFKDELHLLRKGKPYRTFEQFCRAELGESAGNLFDLIKAATYFDEATARDLGKYRCNLLMNFSPEVRQKLVHASKAMTTRELEEKVKQHNKEAGKGKGGKVKGRDGHVRTQKGGRSVDKITVSQMLGTETIKLFAAAPDGEPSKARAVKLSNKPIGTSTSINGVVEVFRVKMMKNGLVLMIERKRAE